MIAALETSGLGKSFAQAPAPLLRFTRLISPFQAAASPSSSQAHLLDEVEKVCDRVAEIGKNEVPALIRQLVAANVEVREARWLAPTLEEVFLSRTGASTGAAQ